MESSAANFMTVIGEEVVKSHPKVLDDVEAGMEGTQSSGTGLGSKVERECGSLSCIKE